MLANIKDMISLTEANQNFSKVARTVDKNGSVIILKNNTDQVLLPHYLLYLRQVSFPHRFPVLPEFLFLHHLGPPGADLNLYQYLQYCSGRFQYHQYKQL
jgi:hypothetical protein